jgi:hypothetical protein
LNKVIIKIDEYKKEYRFKSYGLSELDSKFDLRPIRKNEWDEFDERETIFDNFPKKKENIHYDVKIVTTSYSKIDLHTRIDLKIIGKSNHGKLLETNLIELNGSKSDDKKEKFINDSVDIFRFETDDVGLVSIL